MNTQNGNKQPTQTNYNRLLWLLVLALLVVGIGANYYFGSVVWAIRAAIGIVWLAVIGVVALQTIQGKAAWQFAKAAKTELRKVVWPTRQETVQTTLVVIVMVSIASLLLWGVDSIVLLIIGWLTGQRG